MNIVTTSSPRTAGALVKALIILAFVALAAVAGFFFLSDQNARAQLDQARAQADESAQQLQQLQQTQAAAPAQPAASEENTGELARLRGEIVRLRGVEKQFQAVQTEAQQLRAQLQQYQQANNESAALRNQNMQLQQAAQDRVYGEQCISNLRSMANAKMLWARDNAKGPADMPTDIDLFGKYLPQKPVCPKGGVYTLGTVNARPTCTIPGHTY